jgi:hypothetical protein
MHKNIRIFTTTASLALVAALTLAGCTAAPATGTSAAPKPTSSAAPKPSVDVTKLAAGTVVDSATAAVIKAKGSDTVAVYTTAAGQNIVVTAAAPVPAPVVQDIATATAPVAAPAAAVYKDISTHKVATASLLDFLNQKSKELGGRKFIAVFAGWSNVDGALWGSFTTPSSSGSTGIHALKSKSAMVAAATQWAAANDATLIVVG